jgi:hypothetical protein
MAALSSRKRRVATSKRRRLGFRWRAFAAAPATPTPMGGTRAKRQEAVDPSPDVAALGSLGAAWDRSTRRPSGSACPPTSPTPANASRTREFGPVRFSPSAPQRASSTASNRRAHPPRRDERSSSPGPPRGSTPRRASIRSEPNHRSVSRNPIREDGWKSVTSPRKVPIRDASKYGVPSPRGPSEVCPDRRNKPVRCIQVP